MSNTYKTLVVKLILMDFLGFIAFSISILVLFSFAALMYSSYNYFSYGIWDFYSSWSDLKLSFFIVIAFCLIIFNFVRSVILNISYYFKLKKKSKG